jgi:hypothetical protein
MWGYGLESSAAESNSAEGFWEHVMKFRVQNLGNFFGKVSDFKNVLALYN